MSEFFVVEFKLGEISSDEEEVLLECFEFEFEDEDLMLLWVRVFCGMFVVSKFFCDCLKCGREKFCRCGEENISEWYIGVMSI